MHGASPVCMLWDTHMCECYPIMGMSKMGLVQPVRGWRPAPPLERRMELRKLELKARELFEDSCMSPVSV